MKIRIAYYVIACAISLAAFAGAYGYASPSARTAAFESAAIDAAAYAAYDADPRNRGHAYIASPSARTAAGYAAIDAAIAAYGTAGAVALTAFAGAYILDKRRVPPEG